MTNIDYPARSMPAFKFKDDPPARGGIIIPLEKTFGFMPDVIVVQKVRGQNNKMVVSAILTPDALLKEQTETATKKVADAKISKEIN